MSEPKEPSMSTQLQQAIMAIKAGDKVTGQRLLAGILQADPRNEDAWLWLSNISDTDEHRRQCLERVLAINPNNEMARRRMTELQLSESVSQQVSEWASLPTAEEQPKLAGPPLATEPTPTTLPLPTAPTIAVTQPRSQLKTIRRWEQPFRTEADVTDRFAEYVDELLGLAEDLGPEFRKQTDSLIFAKKQHKAWAVGTGKQNTNMFLAPAVQAATTIAEAIRRAERHQDAFWISNIFGEMCKILIERKRDKYQNFFERLLLVACCVLSDTWLTDASRQPTGDQVSEINKLRHRMGNICQYALGTYFQEQSSRFVRVRHPDSALGERVMNEALAWHFDARLRRLLQYDRPRVKEYVMMNMPIVYRMNLPDQWGSKREEWERLLVDAGYEDTIRLLKDMGDLISVDEVGQISEERRDDVRRAAVNNDLDRVSELLSESAKELKSYLYSEAQARLDYREPIQPNLSDRRLEREFAKVKSLAKTNDPDKMRQALGIAQSVWQQDINNFGLRDWVAYLQARTGNLHAAEEMLEQIRKRRAAKHNFATDWNLAVLAYDRKDEAAAYQLLVPLLDRGIVDEDLVLVTLALSLKLDNRERFLATLPRTMSLQLHPLAIIVAHELGDQAREEELLGDLLRQWETKWELPPVSERFTDLATFEKTVNRAIVEGQIDQLVAWLKARIALSGWVPNYLALARVLGDECQDIDGAFQVLRGRCELVRKKKPRKQQNVDGACRDLLDLCKRSKRKDLGQQAYQLAKKAQASDGLLHSFSELAPEQEVEEVEVKEKEIVPPPLPPDPRLAERLAWVTARLASIRNVDSYVKESQAIEEFGKIVAEMNPQESGTVVELIQSVSAVIEAFSRTGSDDRDTRRLLYDRATGYEKRLAQLLGRSLASATC